MLLFLLLSIYETAKQNHYFHIENHPNRISKIMQFFGFQPFLGVSGRHLPGSDLCQFKKQCPGICQVFFIRVLGGLFKSGPAFRGHAVMGGASIIFVSIILIKAGVHLALA